MLVQVELSELNMLVYKAKAYDRLVAEQILDATQEQNQAWQALWRKGERVEAIKYVRRIMNLGLKDAKDLCERWAATGKLL